MCEDECKGGAVSREEAVGQTCQVSQTSSEGRYGDQALVHLAGPERCYVGLANDGDDDDLVNYGEDDDDYYDFVGGHDFDLVHRYRGTFVGRVEYLVEPDQLDPADGAAVRHPLALVPAMARVP